MTWILIVAVWTVCAVAGALLLGLAIGHADHVERQSARAPDHVPDDVLTAALGSHSAAVRSRHPARASSRRDTAR